MKQIGTVYCQEHHNTVPLQCCGSHYYNICFGTTLHYDQDQNTIVQRMADLPDLKNCQIGINRSKSKASWGPVSSERQKETLNLNLNKTKHFFLAGSRKTRCFLHRFLTMIVLTLFKIYSKNMINHLNIFSVTFRLEVT